MCAHACMHASLCMCLHAYVCVHASVRVRAYICECVCMCVHVSIYLSAVCLCTYPIASSRTVASSAQVSAHIYSSSPCIFLRNLAGCRKNNSYCIEVLFLFSVYSTTVAKGKHIQPLLYPTTEIEKINITSVNTL